MANMDDDAVLEPEPPSNMCLPMFSDVYSKRFVCLTKPPAGMSTMSVRPPTQYKGLLVQRVQVHHTILGRLSLPTCGQK